MMIRTRESLRNENAVTGLELVILLVAVIVIIGYIGYWDVSHSSIPPPVALQKQKQGMISNAITATSNLLMDPGGIIGYPAVDGTISGVPVLFTSQNPAMLGAFELTVQPFMMTTSAIDMGHASVFLSSGNNQEKLSLVHTPNLVCPNWTITGKLNYIPLKGADQDLMLEDTEQFVLLVCPAGHVAPYQQFIMTNRPAKRGNSFPDPYGPL
jgi:hypothetical protein